MQLAVDPNEIIFAVRMSAVLTARRPTSTTSPRRAAPSCRDTAVSVLYCHKAYLYGVLKVTNTIYYTLFW